MASETVANSSGDTQKEKQASVPSTSDAKPPAAKPSAAKPPAAKPPAAKPLPQGDQTVPKKRLSGAQIKRITKNKKIADGTYIENYNSKKTGGKASNARKRFLANKTRRMADVPRNNRFQKTFPHSAFNSPRNVVHTFVQSVEKRALSMGNPRQFEFRRSPGRILNNSSYTMLSASAQGERNSMFSLDNSRGAFSGDLLPQFDRGPLSRGLLDRPLFTLSSQRLVDSRDPFAGLERAISSHSPQQFDCGSMSGTAPNRSFYVGGSRNMTGDRMSSAASNRGFSEFGAERGPAFESSQNRPWFPESSSGSYNMEDPEIFYASSNSGRQPLLPSPSQLRPSQPLLEASNPGGMTFRPSINTRRALLSGPGPNQGMTRGPLLRAATPPVGATRPALMSPPKESGWEGSASKRPNKGKDTNSKRPVEFFKMAVIQEDYPDQQFSDDQFSDFQMDIMTRIEEMPSGSGPQFKYCRLEDGAVVITCADSDSHQWLVQTVEDMLPWNGMTLYVIQASDLHIKRVKLSIRLPAIFKQFSKEEIQKKIEVQNNKFKATQWFFRQEKIEGDLRTILFGIPEEEARALKKGGCRLFIGLSQVYGKILP